ncbi:hypothetical protein [Bacillus pumilus]|uniref:Uncharacterized protein n=1 Tax=Bacillus pumilus TaxID=1408 RepID=A0AAD0MMU3_BACPU|nr:hypothetical protein [Bacillus pumilus]AVM24346.1 hypothetical protein C5695_11050 [Bacillus pumilus]TYS42744.1 hypothetical protein FZC68_10050 [Bacillus pumilus]
MNTVNIKYSPYPNKFSEAQINAEGEEKILTLLLDEVEVPQADEESEPAIFPVLKISLSEGLGNEDILRMEKQDAKAFLQVLKDMIKQM